MRRPGNTTPTRSAQAGRRAGLAVLVTALAAIGGALGSAWAPAAGSVAAAQSRPNVVVIESDDQTQDSIKFMTNVNAMIGAKGATFASSFVNYSLCCPSRATFLTGQYMHNHDVRGNMAPSGGFGRFEALHANNNLAVWLQDAGYTTALIGKYLNGYPPSGNQTLVPPGWTEWHAAAANTYFAYDYDMNENGTLVHHGTAPADFKQDVLTSEAVDFVDRRAPAAKPFFLWLTYLAPHSGGPSPNPNPPSDCDDTAKPAPRHATAFDAEPLPQPPNFNEANVTDKPQAIRNLPVLDQAAIDNITRHYRCRLESILSVDEGVKQVVDELRAQGELGNTLLVYTSDNGFFHGEHRVKNGKVKLYEESIRVPLLMRGPGVKRGVTVRDLAINADLAPTIVDAANAHPGLVMDGRSLLPFANKPTAERGRELSIETPAFDAIRTQRYLYAEHSTGEKELYDLKTDPFELQSQHNDPAYDDVQARLAARLHGLKRCYGSLCRKHPQLQLHLQHRTGHSHGHRCARKPITARIGGTGAGGVEKAEFYVNGELVGVDRHAPFERELRGFEPGRVTLGVRASMIDGRRMTLDRTVRVCG